MDLLILFIDSNQVYRYYFWLFSSETCFRFCDSFHYLSALFFCLRSRIDLFLVGFYFLFFNQSIFSLPPSLSLALFLYRSFDSAFPLYGSFITRTFSGIFLFVLYSLSCRIIFGFDIIFFYDGKPIRDSKSTDEYLSSQFLNISSVRKTQSS